MTEDSKVIERVLDGDSEAFNLLIRQWERPIYNFIVRMIGDRNEAMDLSQDCFMKAYRELHTLKDHHRFSSWLYRIAVEKALGQLPPDQREAVVLKVFQSLKFEEIAAIQDAPISTVKSRLYMGFEKLRAILG